MACDEYTFAISRKAQIGRYHLDCLRRLVPDRPVVDPVPVPIQAHFEGLLASTIACADQIAAGVWYLTQVGVERRGLDATFNDPNVKALPTEPTERLRQLWFDASTLDVREVRRRASHLYYDKIGWAGSYLIPAYEINAALVECGDLIRDREIISYSETAFELLFSLANRGESLLMDTH